MKKTLSSTGLAAIILWTLTTCIAAVHAGGRRNTVEQQADAALTNDTLRVVLANMGLEPSALSKGYLLKIKQDTWTINMQVVLSGDGRKVGFNANLGTVEDPSAITADQWMKLLISNGDIDPSSFYFDKVQKKLYLHRSFDNREVTAAILRREIDNFSANVRSTADLWKFTK